MKYLKSKILVLVVLPIVSVFCQNINETSNMKDFRGIWKFIPPTENYDIDFYSFRVFNEKKMCDITFWKVSKKTHIIGDLIYGFANIVLQVSMVLAWMILNHPKQKTHPIACFLILMGAIMNAGSSNRICQIILCKHL